MSLVSIIIPTYNRAHLVGDAIRSALAQTYRPREVIVVDDGSTDETAAAVRSFGPFVRYLSQTNAGVEQARNTGASQAQGDFFYFLDSDDILLPDALTHLHGQLIASPEAGAAFGQARVLDTQGNVTAIYQPYFDHPAGVISQAQEVEHLLFLNYIVTGAIMLRRATWEKTGGFNPTRGGVGEDWDLWLRVAMSAPLAYEPTLVMSVRPQPNSLLTQYDDITRFLRGRRHLIDMVFSQPDIAMALATKRDRIEAFQLVEESRLAYATFDFAGARAAMKSACKLYPGILTDKDIPSSSSRKLWLKLKVPQVVMTTLRQNKHRP